MVCAHMHSLYRNQYVSLRALLSCDMLVHQALKHCKVYCNLDCTVWAFTLPYALLMQTRINAQQTTSSIESYTCCIHIAVRTKCI
jgi:hypothetical protein